MANGVLVIDKPQDWTSHDVVAKVRRLLHERRTGHGGTLDPMATGILPIFVGRATRAVEFAMEGEKEYVAGLRLGVVTDTQDITGTVLAEQSVRDMHQDLLQVLDQFRGEILQVPPMYSAIKVKGQKLYELARRGQEVERRPRTVTIHSLALEEQESQRDFVLRVRCSKGTYVRTLCHDIGQALGCGGTLYALRRILAGGFTQADAVSLEELARAAEAGEGERLLLPVDQCFAQLPALTVDSRARDRIRNGAPFPWNTAPGRWRVYGPDGDFLMVGELRAGQMYTVKSFFEV